MKKKKKILGVSKEKKIRNISKVEAVKKVNERLKDFLTRSKTIMPKK